MDNLGLISSTLLWLVGAGCMAAMLVQYYEWRRVVANAEPAQRLIGLLALIREAEEELSRLEEKKAGLEALKLELESAELRLGSLYQEQQRVTEEIENLRADLARMDEHRLELARLKEDLEGAREQLADVRQERREYEEKAAIAQAQATGLQAELKDLQARLSDVNGKIETAEARRDEMARELGSSEARLMEVKAELSKVAETRESLSREVMELRLESEHLERDLQQARDELARQQQAVAEMSDRNREAAGRLQELQTRIGVLKRERDEAQRLAGEMEGRVDAARSELEELAKSLEREAEKRNEIVRESAALRGEVDGLIQQRDALVKVVGTLEESLETLQELEKIARNMHSAAPVKVEEALQDLSQPVLVRVFKKGPSSLSEGEALHLVARHLEERGLKFPKRVQLAFHTSLKVADISPLVVLAGVSGTGKSALPEAYAAALGFNFLSLAVQPGWSGPQDLLGFYNYLEKKYKATELARALAQMTPYPKEDLAGLSIQSRPGQMLLVLLDEMNLARVEYYFSEFLSRLEQRRGKDLSNAEQRRQVALPLELAALPEGEPARYLFVGRNVLFVGTMNEDESTQTLSDKVVDRANVLRFGAPARLENQVQNVVPPSEQFLPESVWTGWHRPAELERLGSEKVFVEETLRELNACLEVVGRPFAHRVYRAMVTYICNYPEVPDHRSVRAAVSDQLEQKIFPKLRGLETDRDGTAVCLDRLQKIVGQLDDKELEEAFLRSRQGSLFEWYGVKRAAS